MNDNEIALLIFDTILDSDGNCFILEVQEGFWESGYSPYKKGDTALNPYQMIYAYLFKHYDQIYRIRNYQDKAFPLGSESSEYGKIFDFPNISTFIKEAVENGITTEKGLVIVSPCAKSFRNSTDIREDLLQADLKIPVLSWQPLLHLAFDKVVFNQVFSLGTSFPKPPATDTLRKSYFTLDLKRALSSMSSCQNFILKPIDRERSQGVLILTREFLIRQKTRINELILSGQSPSITELSDALQTKPVETFKLHELLFSEKGKYESEILIQELAVPRKTLYNNKTYHLTGRVVMGAKLEGNTLKTDILDISWHKAPRESEAGLIETKNILSYYDGIDLPDQKDLYIPINKSDYSCIEQAFSSKSFKNKILGLLTGNTTSTMVKILDQQNQAIISHITHYWFHFSARFPWFRKKIFNLSFTPDDIKIFIKLRFQMTLSICLVSLERGFLKASQEPLLVNFKPTLAYFSSNLIEILSLTKENDFLVTRSNIDRFIYASCLFLEKNLSYDEEAKRQILRINRQLMNHLCQNDLFLEKNHKNRKKRFLFQPDYDQIIEETSCA